MPKLLVIGYVWPEPKSSAAGTRMMQLLKFFQNENYQITFATTARETDNKADLNELGIQSEKIKLNDADFDVFLEDLMPHIVLFDRFMVEEQFGWRVDTVCPEAIKILDTEDLHFLRKARHQSFKENKKAEEIYFDSDLAKREIAAIYRCDLSLIISEIELKLLTSKFQVPESILQYLPFLLKEISEKEQLNLPVFEDRKDFISIGNFLHEPNWNAVLYLKEKIWPQIRKALPEAKMQVYGAYPSQKVLNLLNSKENFIINGWAESSREVMRDSRVCLAPIQFGAGLKGKLVEAMQNGTASVTTKIGAEGINGQLAWNGFITESDNEFIEKSIELYTNDQLWEKQLKLGFDIINKRFNKQEHIENFRKKLSLIQNDLERHRLTNFTGKMLKHHLHKSTYFMSRFIEEKNKKFL
ncbi:glycosyltransferase [Christiangramia forsetii]|uniref:Glycosyl transferase, group 1 n=2 Tax=Christiangramia forsetii TaxID=411153 RepID=A0M1M9_CHRFK|nr:glycosyltransferase [Christiangramia forsetii]GGG42131.1 glycosyl transferase [Christiangramia forsetii]CAL66524.1 glycosyl transferase, group 1 [Christiangramia forsetii KT0803]